MLARRIAMLAERMGLAVPAIAGSAQLGLAGTVRVTRLVPLRFLAKLEDQLPAEPRALVDTMSSSDVWTWLEFRGDGTPWRWPGTGDDSAALVRCSEGQLPARGVSVMLAMRGLALRCVPAQDGGLLVIGASPPRRAHGARLLVASFTLDDDPGFDTAGLCRLIAAQTRVRLAIEPRAVERDTTRERDFITGVRRYLEALRDHAVATTPRARYELIEPSPLRLRIVGHDAWPRAFTRPGTAVQLASAGRARGSLRVLDLSDDGDVLTLDGDDATGAWRSHGELQVVAGDAPLRRMREALDIIATGADPAHARLLEALINPESLPAIARSDGDSRDAPTDRQLAAKALASTTPDVALIHGPPGTGKTTVICGIIEAMVARGQRVLLVAPTHVALDGVLQRIGDRPGVTAIRLGMPDNVEQAARRFLLQDRSKDLGQRLAAELSAALHGVSADDPVAAVQRAWATDVARDDRASVQLLLNANLVCATPIGIAMAWEFRDVEVSFDVMIMDEASKATITDFLVPAARARSWILVGDHRQLAPYVDVDELEAVVSERVRRVHPAPDATWIRALSMRLKRQFDHRMHPDQSRVAHTWRAVVETLADPFAIDDAVRAELVELGPSPERWREAYRASVRPGDEPRGDREMVLRLGAELLELQALALPSIFEHLTQLPADRSVRLNVQHRMAPALAAFSAAQVYDNDYPSAPETAALGLDIPSLEAPSLWIDTAFARSSRRYEYPRDQGWTGGGYRNPLEVEVAVELVEACATWAVHSWRGDARTATTGAVAPFEIGVMAFYLQQALALRDAIFRRLADGSDPWRRQWRRPAANGAAIDIHVSIVDRFQGREKDVIILSATRSNPEGIRGHVDNLNRLNVAATRARHKRIIIGDSTTLAGPRRPPNDMWVRLYQTCERKDKWGRVLGARS